MSSISSMANSEIIESDIKVRDYKYKIINGKTLLGIELEAKSSNNYDNKIIVKFYKDQNVVKEEKIDIPFLVGDGIFCVGKSFDFTDFDEIKVELEIGIVLYQESYYPDTIFELDIEKSSKNHLEYKIENNSKDVFKYAVLSLLFYNRGELVCGTDIRLENVLNNRQYYFTYDIPEGLEYTDINTELMLPSTNRYLFKSFYEQYIDCDYIVKMASKPYEYRQHEQYVDRTDELRKSIEELEEQKKITSKIKSKKMIPLIFFLKSLLVGPISAGIGYVATIAIFIVYSLIITILGIKREPSDLIITLTWIGTGLVAFIIIWWKNWYKFDDYVPVKEKAKRIQECDDMIKKVEDTIKDLTDNHDKYVKEFEDANKEIDKYNEEIDEYNKQRQENLNKALDRLAELKRDYPEYYVIEKYDDIDLGFVEAALREGAMTWESVEAYRKAARKEYEEDQNRKAELDELRRKNQLIEEQNQLTREQNQAIKENTEQQRYDAQATRDLIAENARRHDAFAMQQIAETAKTNKEISKYRRQVSTKIDELKYQDYVEHRYEDYYRRI